MVKIYTRKGDQGNTTLYDGTAVAKNHQSCVALGAIDELVSALGVHYRDTGDETFPQIQSVLMTMSTWIASPSKQSEIELPKNCVKCLEDAIDEMTSVLPPLSSFILPANSYHITRALCRRVEQNVVPVANPTILAFINRLSDFLFTYARIQCPEARVWSPVSTMDPLHPFLQSCNNEDESESESESESEDEDESESEDEDEKNDDSDDDDVNANLGYSTGSRVSECVIL